MSVLIKGGRIVTAADDYVGDVYVENGTVSLLGESLDVTADKVIDATGKYVIPGAIDPHTHLEMFFGGTTTCDDFTSGTVSAAFGGTTCLVDFCMQAPGTSFAQALENYFEKIDRCKPVIDVGFHIGVTDLREGGSLEELATLPDQGVTSYKLFMAYKGAVMVDDETLFKTMQTAAETGALVMVHAENGDAIDVIVKEAVAAGHTEPIWHARTRPPETEGEATNRAAQLAHVAGAPLYVVHVSCQESIEPIAIAREKGWDIVGRDLHPVPVHRRVGARPARLRGRQVHLHAAAAARRRTRSASGTRCRATSCASSRPTTARSTGPTRRASTARSSRRCRTAGRGSRTGCTCSTSSACARARITMNRFVELTSTNVASYFGLYPRKGTIAPGSDADIVVWDPEKKLTISASTHHSNVNYNLFEGTEVTGAPEVVLVRGQVIVENDELVAQPGAGQFVKRAKFGEELQPAEKVHGMSDEAGPRGLREGEARRSRSRWARAPPCSSSTSRAASPIPTARSART